MPLIAEFIRRYPWQTVLLSLAVLLAGVADGVGLSAMLPALGLAFDSGAAAAEQNALSREVYALLDSLALSPSLATLLVMIMFGICVKSLMIFVAEQRIGYIAADLATRLRLQLLGAVTASRWRYYVDQSTGRLANSMATEAWRASNAYVYAVKLFAVIVEMLVYTGIALTVSWRATLICLAASLLILVASHGLVRISEKGGSGQTRWYRSLLGTLTDLLQSVKSFKAMGRDDVAAVVLSRETRHLQRHLRREVLGTAGLEAAQEPAYTLVIAVGIYVAIVHLAVDLATVTFLALVLAKVLKQVGKVQKHYQRMMTCDSAYWALQETILEAEQMREHHAGSRPPVLQRAVTLDDLSFGYGDHRVLNHVSMEIPARALTCLVGESGTGKTSIADLIIGLVRPDSGSVRVDGVPLDEIDLGAWRRSIGYVPQENLLLHDTILRNVTLGVDGWTEEDVIRALQAADAWGFVAALPERVNSVVGERGAQLSGGQRQRIMLARALVHRPQLLILDEATSALDSASEGALCRTLAGLKRSVTILAVSHRLAVATVSDRIYRLERGHITGIPPAQLLQARARTEP
ncbi:MAG: ABC transporter ATP-binding protein [Pseudomonadales bacterium]